MLETWMQRVYKKLDALCSRDEYFAKIRQLARI